MKKLLFLAALCATAFGKVVDFTDVVGHKIHLDAPAKKIAIGLYYTEYMAVAGDGSIDKIVGFSKPTWAEWNANLYKMYVKKFPQLDKIEDFGEGSNISAEKIISLNPDVLILAKIQYDAVKDSLQAVQNAGIPVVVIDYHSGQFHELSTKILGLITDQSDRASKITDEYNELLKQIEQRSKAAAQKAGKKASAYVEYGYAGADDNGSTYSHFMWGDLLDKAGIANIADGLVKSHGPINPESVLIADPDIIIIAGREAASKEGKTMLMGNGVSFKQANERLKTFAARAGWNDLKAIKSGNLYGGYHGMLRTLSDIYMTLYLAKAAYPAEFADMDAKKLYVQFCEKYLPIVPDGEFMMKLNDANY